MVNWGVVFHLIRVFLRGSGRPDFAKRCARSIEHSCLTPGDRPETRHGGPFRGQKLFRLPPIYYTPIIRHWRVDTIFRFKIIGTYYSFAHNFISNILVAFIFLQWTQVYVLWLKTSTHEGSKQIHFKLFWKDVRAPCIEENKRMKNVFL